MAIRDVVTLNETASRLEVPQVGDTYNMPRTVAVQGDVTATKIGVGSNVASATGRIKVDAVEFADGSTALTGAGVAGAATLDDVLGNGNSSTKDIVLGGKVLTPAITVSLPAITIVDIAHFDNSADPAWLDKCADKSWYNETRSTGKQFLGTTYANDAAALAANPSIVAGDVYYNGTSFIQYGGGATTYRAGSQKFPMRGFATAEAGRVIIWDTTHGAPTMWMVFTADSTAWATNATWVAQIAVSSLAISGSLLLVGGGLGINTINFLSEQQDTYRPESTILHARHKTSGSVANRNNTTGQYTLGGSGIIHSLVNDVAITVLDDAPLNEYGMRVPTIAVATDGGVSVIKDDGNVWDITAVTPTVLHIAGERLHLGTNGVGTQSGTLRLTADIGSPAWRDSGWNGTTSPGIIATDADALEGDSRVYVGNSGGLSVVYENPAAPALGMVAHVTNTYNKGWSVGDERRAFLANSKTLDRSVKAGTLTEVGTVTETVNAGGRNVYSGFSATNYLQEASHADWNNLGTGDFSIIMSEVKWGTPSASGAAFYGIGDALGGAGDTRLVMTQGGAIRWYVGGVQLFQTATTFTDTAEHVLELKRTGGTVYLLVDGVVVQAAASTHSVSIATGGLTIGNMWGGGASSWAGGQVACVRISATAPTAEQSKFIAAQENALNNGALCLLSNSASVSKLNYNAKTDVLGVVNGTNTDLFKGLKRIGSAATATGFTDAPHAVLTGTKYYAPAIDINSELNAANEQLQKAQPVPDKYYTATATSQAIQQGLKPVSVFNLTAGNFVDMDTNPATFDGFIWYANGLTATNKYKVEVVRV